MLNMENSGQNIEEKMRQTAAEIARRKVLGSYRLGGQSKYSGIGEVGIRATGQMGAYKKMPVNTLAEQDKQKYHEAWQDYYQKYYSSYYAREAKQYIEKEKLKNQREERDFGDEKEEIRQGLRAKVLEIAGEKKRRNKKWKLMVPILSGLVVALVVLFLQYNRLFFAPIMAYVAPSKGVDKGIEEIDPLVSKKPGPEPKLILPKLNIDVPVHFGIANDNNTVMNAMNHGVAQFMIPGASAMPGQRGNLVITGHSAGDIYSNNQYKFVFSGLERLVKGDKIYVNHNSVRYTYIMRESKVVMPNNVEALRQKSELPQLILVTCTPLGTSDKRLLIYADQVLPVVKKEEIGIGEKEEKIDWGETKMPANEKSFFEKVWDFLIGK